MRGFLLQIIEIPIPTLFYFDHHNGAYCHVFPPVDTMIIIIILMVDDRAVGGELAHIRIHKK